MTIGPFLGSVVSLFAAITTTALSPATLRRAPNGTSIGSSDGEVRGRLRGDLFPQRADSRQTVERAGRSARDGVWCPAAVKGWIAKVIEPCGWNRMHLLKHAPRFSPEQARDLARGLPNRPASATQEAACRLHRCLLGFLEPCRTPCPAKRGNYRRSGVAMLPDAPAEATKKTPASRGDRRRTPPGCAKA